MMQASKEPKQMHVTVFLRPDTDQITYLQTCARIRNVSLTRLTQLLINKISDDHLTEAVLDDGGNHVRRKHERRHRENTL